MSERVRGLSALKLSRQQLEELGQSVEAKLGPDYKLNIFDYGKHTFVGFEYRRKDYEQDKEKGVNIVEKAIKSGVYL